MDDLKDYFEFIGNELLKLDLQYKENIVKIVKRFDDHKSRGRLIDDLNNEIDSAEKAISALLIIYLKNAFIRGFNETQKEYRIKKLFFLQQLKKDNIGIKVSGKVLDEVTPYNLSFMQQFFDSYETPFMRDWNEEQRKIIFGFIEDLMMRGYSYDRAKRGLEKLMGENPYGIDNRAYWKMVGVTEGTRVFTQASLASAKALGYTKKRVKVVLGCPHCREYEAQGAIPIDQPFANTPPENPDIPFHPNCMCHYEFELDKGKYFSQYSYEEDLKDLKSGILNDRNKN